jgi:hypothetical protein
MNPVRNNQKGDFFMDNYGRCRDCRYCDHTNKDGYKVHCEYYGTYEDPDKAHDCKHYDDD